MAFERLLVVDPWQTRFGEKHPLRILSLCDDGSASVLYFYFDFRDDNKKYRHNLLRSLLIQLAVHSSLCCDIISQVYSAHGKGTRKPSDEVLVNCLTDVLSSTSQRPVYIVVDALNECPNRSSVRSPRDHILSLIEDLVNLRLPNLHICATSRPETDIRNRLEPLGPRLVSLNDQAGHKEDIAKYIGSEVGVIASDKRWREDDKELVIKTLSEKADGMFRWVFCQLEMLRLCLRSMVRHCINELPDSLDETYERVLKEIHKNNRGHVHRLLQCLLVGIRPLSVDELAKVLTFDPDAIEGEVMRFDADSRPEDRERELLSACSSLITIVDSHGSRVVQFSHFSVKEFLTSDRLASSSEDISRYHILPDVAHTTLAQISLGVLVHLGDYVNKSIARNIPLALYAAEYWVSHAQFRDVSLCLVHKMKTLFDSDKPYFSNWIQIFDIDQPSYTRQPTNTSTAQPLYYSALCGFYDVVEHLLKKHSRPLVNLPGGTHGYPLVAGLQGGHTQVAQLLFQHGANVEQNLLHTAILWPNKLAAGAVHFLLERGADVNATRWDRSTTLHLAADRGNFEVAQMLLQRSADVNSRDNVGETPLHTASICTFPSGEGHRSNLVQLLLKYGAEVDSRDRNQTTALHHASLLRDLDVARVLLKRGADVNAVDGQGRTPLHHVFEAGDYTDVDRFGLVSKKSKNRSSVTQLLLKHGAAVDARDKEHQTPLLLACYSPDRSVVRMLLDHGANINAEDNRGRTPLHQVFLEAEDCSENVFVGVAQILIERGADVNTPDHEHEAPLHLASRLLSLEVA
ncbi:Ankyrin repeat-containing domain protein [Lactarius tabidus]